MSCIIRLDDPDTWPESVERFASAEARRLAGTANHTSDLDITPEQEDQFRATSLTGHSLVTYHCTRLLDHEREDIRTQGLKRLSRQLVDERIELAARAGAITAAQATSLLHGHTFAAGTEQYREDQICLFTSRRTLDDRANGVWRLLATWGGEGIYFAGHNQKHDALLRTLGTSSVVVAAIDMREGWKTHDAHPGLLPAFVGKLLGFDDYDTGVNYTADIPGSSILAIWQPGDAQYDRHRELPHS